jgi:hypothetical protein
MTVTMTVTDCDCGCDWLTMTVTVTDCDCDYDSSVPSIRVTFFRTCCAHFTATQSLVLTTTVPGVGPRKTPTSLSLLHEAVSLVLREMETANRVAGSDALCLAFQLLTNSCQSQECRTVIAKVSNAVVVLWDVSFWEQWPQRVPFCSVGTLPVRCSC